VPDTDPAGCEAPRPPADRDMSAPLSTLNPQPSTTLRSIPVHFIPGHLAVNEGQLFAMLGLDDGRSERAKKKSVYRFLARHDIRRLPGRVFPLRQIEAACQ